MRTISRRLAMQIAGGTLGLAGVNTLRQPVAAARAADDMSPETLFTQPAGPVLGNPQGTLPIVEFFDYRCPYCRRMHPMMTRLLAEQHDIRFMPKEWPVFGGVSVTAARVALAASWQGRFAAVNDALFTADAPLDAAKVNAVAEAAGVDMSRLATDLVNRGHELDSMLGTIAMQAESLALQGTPGFVIGKYLVPGAMSYDDLLGVVAKARAAPSPA